MNFAEGKLHVVPRSIYCLARFYSVALRADSATGDKTPRILTDLD